MNNQLANVSESAFLPDTYEVPVDNKYMKLREGKNRFRIMSSPVLGYEWWVDGPDGSRKVNRIPMNQSIPVDKVKNPEDIRHFWAMMVWNYQDKKIQMLELLQRSLQKFLYSLAHDPDWGSPVNRYDIMINRVGTGKEDTKYDIVPIPPKPTDPDIMEEFSNTFFNLKNLFVNKDWWVQEIESSAVPEEEYVDPEEVDQGLQIQETQAKAQARTVAQKYRR